MSKHLSFNPNNPSPLVQPFLVLHFRGDRCSHEWFIDVDGKIDLYLKNYTAVRDALRKNRLYGPVNWMSQATDLLQAMMQELAAKNRIVNRVSAYEGLAGANYILRNGQFFKWIDVGLEHLPKDAPMTQWPDIADYLPQILAVKEDVSS